MSLDNTIHIPGRSAIDLYLDGREAQQQEHNSKESGKLNTLRGGSAGCHLGGGQVIGRFYEDVARYLGYSLPKSPETGDIFDLGYSNESNWEEKFRAAKVPFKADEEYPLRYEINGTKVSGRPDAIVGFDGEEFVPEFGIEHKVISSYKVAGKMLHTPKPKDENFIQACHYSYMFDLPYTLVYSYYGISLPNFFDKKALKEMGLSEIRPFKKEYQIGCDSGNFYWSDINTGNRVDTSITAKGIREYYELILECIEKKDLTTVQLSTIDMHGSEMYFNPKAYDGMRLTTDMSKGWDHWVEDLERMSKQPHFIQYRKINKKPTWQVINTETGEMTSFGTHQRAYDFMLEEGGKTII